MTLRMTHSPRAFLRGRFASAAPVFRDPIDLQPAPALTPGLFVILCDRGGVGTRLAESLRAAGDEVVRVVPYEMPVLGRPRLAGEVMARPDVPEDLITLLGLLDDPERPIRGIINLWPLDAPAAPTNDPLRTQAKRVGLLALSETFRALDIAPPVFIATRGAWPTAMGFPPSSPGHQLVWTAGRVLAIAHPNTRPTLVELDPTRDADVAATALHQVIAARPRARRLAARGGRWYCADDGQAQPAAA